jgi:NitT/TauT family transport system substrate-binding protein
VRARLLLAVLVSLAAGPARADDLVRLGNLKFAHYGAVAYAKELAPRYHLRIEERLFAKGVDIMPAIVAGEIDAAASAAEAAIAGRANGAPVVAVAGFARGAVRLLAATGSGITTVEGLKGKRVGVTRGGTQELVLLAELDQHHLTWSERPGKDVRILYLAFADLNQALAGHQIDAMCQTEPQSSQALARKIAVEIIRPYDTPVGEPVRAFVVTEALYRQRRDVARRLVEVLVAATRAFQQDPALAERYVRETFFHGQLAADEYRQAMSNAAFSTDLSVEKIAAVTALMQKYGVGRMAAPPRAADWVKLDLLRAARPAP